MPQLDSNEIRHRFLYTTSDAPGQPVNDGHTAFEVVLQKVCVSVWLAPHYRCCWSYQRVVCSRMNCFLRLSKLILVFVLISERPVCKDL